MEQMTGKAVLIASPMPRIGKATAEQFGAERGRVVLVARRSEQLQRVASGNQVRGGEARWIAADVTREAEFERVVNEAVAASGRQDVPFNAAGIIANGTIENMALSVQDRLFAVNVRGPSYLMQRAMDHLIQSKGNVVNVSSADGICAFPRVLGLLCEQSRARPTHALRRRASRRQRDARHQPGS